MKKMKKKLIAMLCLLGMISVASACGAPSEEEHEHAYGEVAYAWVGDKCTATRTCACEESETETVTGIYVKDTDATCAANEKGHYEATFENEVFEAQETDANSVEIPDTKTEHIYGEGTYTWVGDKCTATRTCTCTASDTETVTGVYVKDTDASCTENEKGHYEATFENEVFEAQETAANSVEAPDTAKHSPAEAVLEGREMVTRCSVCGEPIETVPVYTTFNDGDAICDPAFGYALGDYGVAMEKLEDKAVHFEFKFETDGSFTVCLLASDWANVTGYFTVAKSGDSVTTTMGRVVALSDGWYAWELNKRAFAGDGASKATNIGLFYATEAVTGTVMIDFTSFAAVPMYRNGTTFTNGEVIGGATGILLGANAVPMTSLENKALRFEFKFETEGSFNICLLAADWANVTGYFTVAKSGDSVTTTIGRIVDLGDGWYAWELNKRAFAGDGASRATDIGLVFATEAVKGTVMIDFTSFEAVPMYRTGTTYTDGEVIGGAAGYQFGAYAVPMAKLSGKALHFEFKIEGDGSFNICLLDINWKNVTDYFTVTKSGDSVTATTGRIVDLGDGWYAWEQNTSAFAGDGAGEAAGIEMVYATKAVTGTVVIDWTSLSAVDAF